METVFCVFLEKHNAYSLENNQTAIYVRYFVFCLNIT